MRDAPSNRAEFSRLVIVENLPPSWTVMRIVADPDERVALARRFGLVALERLEADVCLQPMANMIVRVRGNLRATVIQICVITLEPIAVTMAETFILTYRPPSRPSSVPGEEGQVEIAVATTGDDPPDPVIDGTIDVGEAVAEHLALALNPFPRKLGAEFRWSFEGEDKRFSPFAMLAVLRPSQKD